MSKTSVRAGVHFTFIVVLLALLGFSLPSRAATAGVPGVPSLSVLQDWTNGGYNVQWSKWSGPDATSWILLEDGKTYASGQAPASVNGGQTYSLHIGNRPYAAHLYQVKLSNAAGSSVSVSVPYESDGASTIVIKSVDSPMQARQVTIPLNTNSTFTVQMVTGASGSIQLSTNNSSVISFQMNSATTLQIKGLAAGRASLRIVDSTTGATRWLGVRVKQADGTLPGLPNYVPLGSVSEDSSADLSFWRNFGTGDANRRMDIRYIYINGGPKNEGEGWRTWTQPDGFRVTSYVRESLKMGMIPFFVWYNISGAGDSYTTDTSNAQDATFMQGYFTDLVYMCNLAKAEAPDEMMGVVIEPDFLGYLAQNNVDTSTFVARTDAAYTAGILVKGVDPDFPNTINGLVQAINYIIAKNLPNAYFGWETALWASPAGGWTTPIGSKGVIRSTDTLGVTAGRQAVTNEAAAIADYYIKAGVLTNGASFMSIDKYGLDAGYEGQNTTPANSTWFWNAVHWENYLAFVKALSAKSQLPIVLWQLPVGHINSSQAANPAGGLFPTLTNVSQHYEDSTPDFFLGDSFVTTGDRLSYFSTKDTVAAVTVSGNTVTWGSAMSQAAASGVRVVLFGAGVGDSTQGVGDPATDGNWWITKAQRYLANPVASQNVPALSSITITKTPGSGSGSGTGSGSGSGTGTGSGTGGTTGTPIGTGANVTLQSGSIKIAFTDDTDWVNGFQGTFTLTNTGTTAISAWTLKFTAPITISSIWNGTVSSSSGGTFVVVPASWNASIAPGASVSVGFIGAPGLSAAPTAISVSAQ